MIRIILIGLAGSFLLASGVSAQDTGRQYSDTAAMRGRPMRGEKIMRMMDSADARLDRMVSTMNKATGSSKVQAMAAVINEMVAQRKQMRGQMRVMMEGGGMMERGGGGRQGPPMMQNMRPPTADTAAAQPAMPDTADHTQRHDSAK